MAVGLSDGTGYEDNNEYLLSATQPRIDVYKDKAPQTTSTMPLGVSTEPAGAFKSETGSQVAPTYNFDTAVKEMGLNSQEQYLYQKHLENLTGSGGVDNPDGSRSSLYQSVQEHDGKFYNIPTVWNGKREVQPYTKDDGTVMDVPNDTALSNVDKEGWDNYPSYSNPDEADARYIQMHSYMEKDTAAYKSAQPDVHPTPDYLNPPDRDTPPAKDVAPRDDSQDIHINPWVTITPEDISTGISVALSAGAGTMQGVKSATFDRAALYKAQNLEMDGAHPEDIWNQTSTGRGADGRWRQEIPDQDANILSKGTNLHPAEPAGKGMAGWTKIEAPESISIKDNKLPDNASLQDLMKWFQSPLTDVRLSHVLDHPELYKAYPWLKDTKVFPMPEGVPYSGMTRGKDLFMNKLPTEEFTSTLMHEVQHLIQDHEGFAHGANPNMFIPKNLKEAEQQFIKVRQEAEADIGKRMGDPGAVVAWKNAINLKNAGYLTGDRLDFLKALEEKHPDVYRQLSNIVKSENLLFEAKSAAADRYRKVMGEVESRNVQARLDFSHLDRAINSPMKTEEMITPRSQQINSTDIANHIVGRESASVPGEFTPHSRRWPNNDNARPLNEHEQYIQMYDAWHAFGEKMNPKSELDTHTYNKMGKALADWQSKTYGYDVPYVPIKHDLLDVNKLR